MTQLPLSHADEAFYSWVHYGLIAKIGVPQVSAILRLDTSTVALSLEASAILRLDTSTVALSLVYK